MVLIWQIQQLALYIMQLSSLKSLQPLFYRNPEVKPTLYNHDRSIPFIHKVAGEVKRQLVLANVSAERLAVNGFGSSKPLKQGNSADDKAENRRVEFIVK